MIGLLAVVGEAGDEPLSGVVAIIVLVLTVDIRAVVLVAGSRLVVPGVVIALTTDCKVRSIVMSAGESETAQQPFGRAVRVTRLSKRNRQS